MWFDLYLYHQVSWWTTHTCVSLLRYAQIHSIIDAFWDVYGLFDLHVLGAFASTLRTWVSSSLSLVSAKKLLEFFKDISEWVLATLLSLESSSPKLIVKPFKARESLSSLTKSAEWVLLSLLLFVTSHACLIVNPLFLIIAKRLICFIDLCKLFLRALTLIHIWMKLLGPFEIRLLYVGLLCSPIDAQNGVIILLTASSVERERRPESIVFGAE